MNQELVKRTFTSLIIIFIALFFIIKGSYFFIFFMLVFFIVTAFEWYQMSKKKIYLYPGLFFLLFSTYSAYLFRSEGTKESFLFFLIVILTCVTTDIGGYIFGKVFKGPKLTSISPNKTYAGMLGGFFLSILSINILLINTQLLGLNYYEFTSQIFVLVLLISSISQIGDLVISYFKRKCKIKNTGKLLPGHGGLLDRVDGLIFAVPFSFILFKFI